MNPHTQKPLKSTMFFPRLPWLTSNLTHSKFTITVKVFSKTMTITLQQLWWHTKKDLFFSCFSPHTQNLAKMLEIWSKAEQKAARSSHLSPINVFNITMAHSTTLLFLSKKTALSHSSSPISWFALPLKMSTHCFYPALLGDMYWCQSSHFFF